VLSTPNLLTLDNEEAKIVIGQNVPFPTGSYSNPTTGGLNPFSTVERKDVGLTLRVRPTINENGTVRMSIFQETSNVVDTTLKDANGPTTDKRSLESSVLVEDGGLVMLGGLLSDTYYNTVQKVPLAGDLPIVGNLFKSEFRSRDKKNLMMFLRPSVMRDASRTEAFAFDRYDQIRGTQQKIQPDTSDVMLGNADVAPVLPSSPLPRPSRLTSGALRAQDTATIPQSLPPLEDRKPAPNSPRGGLPPTADPATQRELP